MAWQVLADDAPGHAADGLVAHLLAINDATNRAFNEEILKDQGSLIRYHLPSPSHPVSPSLSNPF